MGNTISVQCDTPTKEGTSSGNITPGHLLERTSAADTVKVAATAAIKYLPLFAIENGWQGDEIDTVYATAKKVFFRTFLPGDVVLARIKNGEDIAIGDKLVSATGGELAEFVSDSSATIVEQSIIGVALEACDMSGSSGVDPSGKCKVEIW